ncbi:MAG: formylglycine-generating enzyme family protein, partial [Bacteroidota bacterium]
MKHINIGEMVYVEGGSFEMGSNDGDSNEKPVHRVTVDDFYIGKYVVTQKEWEAVMGNNPSNFQGDNLPVEQVSWDDVQEFLQKLSTKTGKNYRLPTEAEWEYAARGGHKSSGNTYSGSNRIDNVAWYDGNSNSQTHTVGTKQPNELGIYDMTGNVWEWCSDWYGSYSSNAQTNPQGSSSGSDRVLRGGSFTDDGGSCRVAYRSF